jgi:3-hydroxyisobutyrate dehydrogenase
MKKIGFIGVGHMGSPMVKNLLKAGYEVTVYDISTAALAELKAIGARIATSLQEIAATADVIFTMLQKGEQVEKTCLGAEGLFSHLAPECLFIDCSSIEISLTLALHQAAEKRGVAMLDAPVSGGVAGANNASLTFMVGGAAKDFLRAQPILAAMGKKIIHAGTAGHGGAAKICNNLILGISMIAVCEGFNLAEKLGLDAKKFFEICANSSSQCWSLTSYCPVPGVLPNVPANNDYQPGFAAKMMLKDLLLSQQAAATVNATTPLGAAAAELYALFVSQGHADTDFSGIIQMLALTS